MPHKGMSLATKVYLTLGTIFTLVLIVAVLIAAESERELGHEMVRQQLVAKADSYFDSLNIMMLTGTINTREVAREKVMSHESVTDARILRSSAIDRVFGKGLPYEYPIDELDHQGLSGQTVLYENFEGEHTLTYIQPIIAQENYRGTNCLACHQVDEGTQLGAIRIDYSLTHLDQQIQSNLLTMAGIQGLMFLAALGLVAILMKRFLLSPIKTLHRAIQTIEKNADLSFQLKAANADEIGATSSALNRMLRHFSGSMKEVVGASKSLETSAHSIASSSADALNSAQAQQDKTTQMSAYIDELQQSIETVRNNASSSSQASDHAMTVSASGTEKTRLAISGISAMTEAIDQAVQVINNLDERSTNVGSVLDVIKGIAEQTNLLALNAAIEAARAGESGRGFAVVADEVRSLAIKTHESTQEIENMIAQLQSEAQGAAGAMDTAQEKANQGVEQVQQASNALSEMASQVDHMNQLNGETLHAVEAQVGIGQQVQAGIEHIGEHANQTAQVSQQTANVSNQLVGLSENLSRLVSLFKL